MNRALRDASSGLEVATRPRAATRASVHLNGPAVECLKNNGSWLLFSRYSTRAEAEQVRDRLVGLGQATRIVAPTTTR